MTDKIYSIEEIKNIVGSILPSYEIGRVFLFGSYSRNEASRDSDLDFYIEDYSYKKFHTLATLFADLEEGFDKSIDIVTDMGIAYNYEKAGMKELLDSIRRDGVFIYGKQG